MKVSRSGPLGQVVELALTPHDIADVLTGEGEVAVGICNDEAQKLRFGCILHCHRHLTNESFENGAKVALLVEVVGALARSLKLHSVRLTGVAVSAHRQGVRWKAAKAAGIFAAKSGDGLQITVAGAEFLLGDLLFAGGRQHGFPCSIRGSGEKLVVDRLRIEADADFCGFDRNLGSNQIVGPAKVRHAGRANLIRGFEQGIPCLEHGATIAVVNLAVLCDEV